MFMIYLLLAMISFVLGLLLGKYTFKQDVVEVCDSFKPNPKRTDGQLACDAILQLQNEIAKSGCLRVEKKEDGTYLVSLRLVK